MKKGFTLIELLAVIIVLAIVALIATPIVLDVIEDSKKSAGESEANLVLSGLTSYCNNEDFKIEAGTLTEENRKCNHNLTYYIDEIIPNKSNNTKIEDVKYENGKITSLKVESNGYTYKLKNGIMTEESGGYIGANPCTYDGELTQGVEYTDELFTYRYQETSGGWSVELTNKSPDNTVSIEEDTPLCSSINSRPIVSMACMFCSSNIQSINNPNWDTSNVTDMNSMFAGCYGLDGARLVGFNTSNVTDMSYMFAATSEIGGIDLSSFDTSNVTNMSGMFAESSASWGYARTQEDADRFTNEGGANFTFSVK